MSSTFDFASNALNSYGEYQIWIKIVSTLFFGILFLGGTYYMLTDEEKENDTFGYVSGIISLILFGIAYYNFRLRNNTAYQQGQGIGGISKSIFGSSGGGDRSIF